jgi:hypothetical protein
MKKHLNKTKKSISAYRFLYVLLFSFLTETSIAQIPKDILQKKISIPAGEIRTDSLIKQLTRQAGVYFSFNTQKVIPAKKIKVGSNKFSLFQWLQVLENTFGVQHKVIGNHIILAESVSMKRQDDLNNLKKPKETVPNRISQKPNIIENKSVNDLQNGNYPVEKERSTADANQMIKPLGSWYGDIKNSEVDIRFHKDGENSSEFTGNRFSLAEFKNFPLEGKYSFSMTREAGTMQFEGSFKDGKGSGRFQFVPSKPYKEYMGKEGYVIDDDKQMTYFMANVTPNVLQMLRDNGYTKIREDELIPISALHVDAPYIQSLHRAGYRDVSLDQLIPLKAMDIDSAYISGLRKAGLTRLSIDDIISKKAEGFRTNNNSKQDK